MAKQGRPTKYESRYCKMLIEHMAKGFTFESFASVIDVCRDTLYEWQNKHEKFSDAHKKGIDKSLFFWEDLGRAGATGAIPNFNSTAWIFNMKNKHAWRDKKEITGSDDGPIRIKQERDVAKNILKNPETLEAALIIAEAMNADGEE